MKFLNKKILAICFFLFTTLLVNAQISIVWDGSTDNNWDEPSNWTPAQVPAFDDSVTIDGGSGSPEISNTDAECEKLVIAASSSLLITTGGTLGAFNTVVQIKVFGTLTVDDDGEIADCDNLDILSGGVMNMQDDAALTVNILANVVGTFTVLNDAAVDADEMLVDVGGIVNNEGEIAIAGDLEVDGNLTVSDDGLLDSDNMIDLDGTVIVEDNSETNMGGELDIDDGEITVRGNANMVCYDLVIGTGGTLNIQNNGWFDQEGDVTENEGEINIENTGAFYQSDVGLGGYDDFLGTGTLNLTRVGTIDASKFNYWSSPIEGHASGVLGGSAYAFDASLSTATTTDDQADPGWVGVPATLGTGVGYAAGGAGSVTFSGTPHFQDYMVSVTYVNAVPYVLLGNPYTSPINIDEFFTVNDPLDGVIATSTMYFWDSQTTGTFGIDDYATVNTLGTVDAQNGPGTYNSPYNSVPTCQGFFIELQGDGDIEFNHGMRENGQDNTRFWKQSSKQRMWMGVFDMANNAYNETLIGFVTDATDGLDPAYDATKLKGNNQLSLYSMNNNKELAIQGLPTLTNVEVTVPLGISVDANKSIKFSLMHEELLEDFDIYLEDYLLGTSVDLRNTDYFLNLSTGEHNARFAIKFSPKFVATGIDQKDQGQLNVFYAEDLLFIENKSNEILAANAGIFDITGRKIQEFGNFDIQNSVTLKLKHNSSGCYIVSINTKNQSYREKIYVTH